MKTVLITGASGFIASRLAKMLQGEFRVIGVSRSGAAANGFEKVSSASLGESLNLPDESEIDVVVHTANHAGKNEYSLNVDGTWRWFEEAKQRGATLQILLSTLSAAADATSDYGRAKYELEQRFLKERQVVFRLGVVVGNGGMFARMKAPTEKLPVVPLLDNGSARVFVLGIDFLCDVLSNCIRSGGEGLRDRVWQIQQPQPHTLHDVMMAIRRQFRSSCRFVPIPSLPILWAMQIVEYLPLQLPISATNVRGMRQSRNAEFRSDFEHFGYPIESLDTLVEKAANEE